MDRLGPVSLHKSELSSPSEAKFIKDIKQENRPAEAPVRGHTHQPAAAVAKPKPRRSRNLLLSGCCLVMLLAVVAAGYLGVFDLGAVHAGSEAPRLLLVIVNGETQELITTRHTVGEALKEQEIFLAEEDRLNFQPTDLVENNMVVSIEKCIDILIKVDGQERIITTLPLTVRELLAQASIELAETDEISLAEETILFQPQELVISRISTDTVTEESPIEPTIRRRADSNLAAGVTQTISQGEAGVRTTTYQITYRDGVEIAREEVSSEVTKEPGVTEIAFSVMQLASRGRYSNEAEAAEAGMLWLETSGGQGIAYSKVMSVEATAYTHTGNRTATGTWPQVGTIAVDPRVIPLGTEVYVEGYGFARAEDTGGVIKGNIIDLFMETKSECFAWGRRQTTIYILN